MANLALYRKYRSRDFNELVGQQHIATTLQNALKSQRISHAYLFTGPRGVGKTSTARILARRINGLSLEQAKDHLDIIEIDAASNRRIDEVRDLREKVHVAPTSAKYKVYIIDEVHMLTNEAFNALLKTLEEPPGHIVFILATTEPHKLPETIISRTQRYSFRPVDVPTMVAHLKMIASKEKIRVDEGALELIAIAGDGSFRDSISLLDQLSNLGKGKITAELVTKVLGLAPNQSIEKMVQAVVKGDAAGMVTLLDGLTAQGLSINQLLQQILRFLQKLTRMQLGLDKSASEAETWIIGNATAQQLTNIMQKLSVSSTQVTPISLEANLVKLCLENSNYAPAPLLEPIATPTLKTPHTQQPAKTIKSSKAPPGSSELTEDKWLKALIYLKAHNNSLYALLRSGKVEFVDGDVHVSFRFQFHRRRLEDSKNRKLVEDALYKIYGRKITVHCKAVEEPAKNETAAEASTDDAVNNALQILGGEIVSG